MSYSRLTLYLYMVFCSFVGQANEAPLNEVQLAQESGQDRFFQEFLNMLATLGLVVAVIFILSWFLKKMVNTRIQHANSGSQIKIIEQRSLSPKSTLYLVEIDNQTLLLGEAAGNLSCLKELSADFQKQE